MNKYVAGSGKLAREILSLGEADPSFRVTEWDKVNKTSHEKAIVLHTGSGRQRNECFEFCKRTNSIFIELSTGLGTENTQAGFPIVLCPNSSILILRTIALLKAAGDTFKDYKISIMESHQSAKTTEPGTAYALARALHFPVEKIVSIRDKEIQFGQLGIPGEFLDSHAYHKIIIEDENDEIKIETKVLGHRSYARGVKKIAEALTRHSLKNKQYTILELVESNVL